MLNPNPLLGLCMQRTQQPLMNTIEQSILGFFGGVKGHEVG